MLYVNLKVVVEWCTENPTEVYRSDKIVGGKYNRLKKT